MYVIETYNLSGAKNMAYDLAIGELTNEVTLRFYTWKVPTLSLGKHQDENDLDIEYINSKGFDVVKRPSGGRAVLHWDELTYSVVIPQTHQLFKTGVLELYNFLSKLIVDGLKRLGFPVEIVEGKRKTLSHVCFQTPSAYEIVLNGIKVVGSAQTRTQSYILQHGSIVLIPHEEVKYCFKTTKHVNIPMIGLYNYKYVSTSEIVSSISHSFSQHFGEPKRFGKNEFDMLEEKSKELEGRFLWKI
ncbi:MAG: lipoate--protein ligase family protein [Fervidobacterium sp.]|jgi:lipoate-protein ligase A